MRPLEFKDDTLNLIDQTKLPLEYVTVSCKTYREVAEAINSMVVRGAPAIGVAAAYGIAIGAHAIETLSKKVFFDALSEICNTLRCTRPTAINLFWAIDRVYARAVASSDRSIGEIKDLILREACLMDEEDVEINRAIGRNGNDFIKPGATILTHCNAGALATCDYGTALGVIRAAHEAGKNIKVYADETRPFLQGARLTAWELQQDNIPVTLICDNMAGCFMRSGEIDCVVVGADRVALNGDIANKVGTYMVAVLARENGIPFYVAAPISSIDFSTETGDDIPIEERRHEEVTHIKGVRIAPEGISVRNPAFDITPGRYITAIITEKAVVYPPFYENIGKLNGTAV